MIFNFNKNQNIKNWRIVNDVVMGGRSSSTITLNENGEGFFSGNVSLENNGGFCMAQYKMNPIEVLSYSKICLRLKGDQKNYQFRIRAQTNDYFMYIAPFSTTGDWQEIEIPLNEMYPAFRGKKLDMPNFNKATFEEIAFLIGNKKEEEFKLVIDRIELK